MNSATKINKGRGENMSDGGLGTEAKVMQLFFDRRSSHFGSVLEWNCLNFDFDIDT